ncbi:methyl-accepting chemotaxis protein [Paenibacillus hamazuiensis]|uniref:methyl-accepting chemotaxis protein n=1 Tax=Paenibacillus hamazuiensis TaxID=2936508 RepID=UPI00200EFD64|nr:methyl-accepting chemotaxis protein [Paenibacillus hamazuiensis]
MKISTLLKYIGVAFGLLSVCLLVSVMLLRANYYSVRDAVNRQAEFKKLGIDLADASDYLTNEARQYVQFGDKAHFNNYWREVNDTKTRDRVVARLKELNAPQDELDLIQEAKNKSDALVKTEDAAMKAVEQGDFNTARKLMFDDRYEANKAIIMEPIKKFQDKMNTRAQNETEAAEDNMFFYLYAVIIIIVIVAASMICSVILLARRLKPLKQVAVKLEELSGNKGDLTARLPEAGQDEIGQLSRSFNTMLGNYQLFMRQIFDSAQQLAAASHQISASTEEIAGGSQSQAMASQNLTELFKELSAGMNSVARNTESASELSDKTAKLSSDGNQIVTSSMDAMSQLNQQLSEIVQHSDTVGKIIEVIDDIADQTNLLALNAAIEAARAGDQGRGFAVVADEVRKLAERSGEATKEITQIIKMMQESMKKSAAVANESYANSQKSGEAFSGILSMVSEVASRMTEIAAAVEQQSAQSTEILITVETIAASNEESAAAAQEAAASTQTLVGLANHLNKSVSAFNLG